MRAAATVFGVALALGCSNNPYPDQDDDRKVLYLPFSEPPKTLDPALAYSTADHAITGKVYDTLLEYHYLKRPYELVGGLAQSVPEPHVLPDGGVEYRFELRPDLWFQNDPCFALVGAPKRRIVADDFVFELQRLADPALASPVVDPFSVLRGFVEFSTKLKARRAADPEFGKLRIDLQYQRAGGFSGARSDGPAALVITLDRPYPQILYWFAMNFSSPMPWEAVAHYDGKQGRPQLSEHPVSSGPFVVGLYEKRARIVLDANPEWYGARHPEWHAPGAIFPSTEGVVGLSAAEKERLDASQGLRLPALARIEYRREEESIPAFSKFLQGYYDMSAVVRESFNRVIQEGGLSEDMKRQGMQLEKSVVPAVYYIGFNMDDAVVGRQAGEKSKLLRQALSLAIDSTEYLRLFSNGRGLPAHSPLPPGLFGYDPAYRNPYRSVDLKKAAELLTRAGYPEGIDSATGRALRLTFDVPDTSPEGRLRFLFWTNQWRRLGIDVQLSATNYNKFQEKVRDGAYQIFQWGWVADYPDPENFLFLLTTPMARSVSQGPNTANFKNATYDRLFEQMRTLENGPERRALLDQMRGIVEDERPWIELFHPEDYALVQGWLKNVRPVGLSIPTAKYYDIDPAQRRARRTAWNEPVLAPAFALVALLLLLLVPAVRTFMKERQ